MTHPQLTFDKDRHQYMLADGRLVPSVTQILRDTGVSLDFEELGGMSSSLADKIDAKRHLGTIVHEACHFYDDDDLAWETVGPEVKPYVEAWATFRKNTGLLQLARERMVFHAAMFYCGTLDGIFMDPRNRLVLCDIKIGDPASAACHLQTMGYLAAYQFEHPGVYIAERWSVQLVPGRSVPYRVQAYADWKDADLWASCVAVFHAQKRRAKA